MDPIEAGRAFVDQTFPEALVAIVGGSFLRGEETPTSDLDLLIVTTQHDAPFRASYRAFGRPIEAFVHTTESYRRYFESDRHRRRPSLATICGGGETLRDTADLANCMKAEAEEVSPAFGRAGPGRSPVACRPWFARLARASGAEFQTCFRSITVLREE